MLNLFIIIIVIR